MLKNLEFTLPILFLLSLSVFILNSIAPGLFPWYFVFIGVSLIIFWFFSQIGFEIVSLFSTHLYIFSIFLLLLTIVIGSVTRGTVRWIPIGSFSLQPAEIVRPFLLVFFANYLTKEKITIKRILKALDTFDSSLFFDFNSTITWGFYFDCCSILWSSNFWKI